MVLHLPDPADVKILVFPIDFELSEPTDLVFLDYLDLVSKPVVCLDYLKVSKLLSKPADMEYLLSLGYQEFLSLLELLVDASLSGDVVVDDVLLQSFSTHISS